MIQCSSAKWILLFLFSEHKSVPEQGKQKVLVPQYFDC